MIPYGKLVAAVVLLLVIAGAYVQGRRDGTRIVQADYAQRDLKAATDYAAKEREITETYRAKEAKLAQQVASVGTNLQRERVAREKTQNDLNAALVAGSLVLRDPGPRDIPACSSGTPQVAAPASGSDAGTGANISKTAASFLLALTAEADAVVVQLTACQQVLTDERK